MKKKPCLSILFTSYDSYGIAEHRPWKFHNKIDYCKIMSDVLFRVNSHDLIKLDKEENDAGRERIVIYSRDDDDDRKKFEIASTTNVMNTIAILATCIFNSIKVPHNNIDFVFFINSEKQIDVVNGRTSNPELLCTCIVGALKEVIEHSYRKIIKMEEMTTIQIKTDQNEKISIVSPETNEFIISFFIEALSHYIKKCY